MSRLASALLNTARSNGLLLPTMAGGGVALPGSLNARTSAQYAGVLHGSANMRQMANTFRRGGQVMGKRIDSASKNPARDATLAAHVASWADYLGARFPEVRKDALVPMASQGLTSFLPGVYQIEHAGLVAWEEQILKVDRSFPDPAAENYVWYEQDTLGVAKVGSTYSAMDVPMVAGTAAQANYGVIVPALVGMETNFMDDRRAAMARSNGKPDFKEQQKKAEACQRALAEFCNFLWLYGDPILGIDGFHNHPAVATISLTNGSWVGNTAANINADLVQILNTIRNQAQGGRFADLSKLRILLPPDQMQYAENLIVSAAGNVSVLSYFKTNNGLKDDQIQSVYDFKATNSILYNGGPQGLTLDTGAVIYNFGDDADPVFLLPQPIEMPAPPRQNGLSESTFYHLRAGGMKVEDGRRIRYIQGL